MELDGPGCWSTEPEDLEASPYLELLNAARSGDISSLISLLDEGVSTSPRRPLPSSLNPVVIEACCGARPRDVLEELLSRDAGAVAAVDPALGAAPLHWACMRGDLGACQLLLSHGASLEAATREGFLPLHCAATSGHRALLEALIERGAPVNARAQPCGATALLLTSEGGHVRCIELLLRHGADVNAADAGGTTPLLAAAAAGHARAAAMLATAGADARTVPTVPPRRGVLHWAAHHGMASLASALLAVGGVVVDARDSDSETPLLLASRRGYAPLVSLLLERGAQVDAVNTSGVTPLMAAAFFGREPVVRALLGRGASVHAVDGRRRRTALHWGAAAGEAAVVAALLEAAADAAAVDAAGRTALELAREVDAEEVLRMLG